MQHLAADILAHKVDIALVAETWFNDKILDANVAIESHILWRRDRCKRRDGGVCAFVRKDVESCAIVPRPATVTKLEIMWLQCNYNSQCYIIACCYHPPKPRYDPVDMINELSLDMEVIVSNPKYGSALLIVAGDFNMLDTTFLEIRGILV
jgi:hypothetical protein